MRKDIDATKFRALLKERLEHADKAFSVISENSLGESLKESTGEDSTYDQHSADLANETFQREKDLGLKEGLEQERGRIRQALDRIETGDYGVCERCGGPIPEGRLLAVPEAELCIECQKEQETVPPKVRPVEEDTPRMGVPGGFELLADEVNAGRADRRADGRGDKPVDPDR